VIVRNTARHDARVLRCGKTLCSLGYETTVIAVSSAEESAERLEIDGIPVVRLTPRAPLAGAARRLRRRRHRGASAPSALAGGPEGGRAGRLARAYRLLRTLSYYRRGIAAMRVLRPRIVHCNDYNTMWIGVAAKLLLGSAVIYDSHELWADRNGRSEPRWWLLACEALFLRVADRNLATSPGHAEEIARRHRVAQPLVVRNIAEQPAGHGVRDGSPPREPSTIVYVGAVTGGRGLEQAIAALPHAAGVELRILGPGRGEYREGLAALAAQEDVSERVRIEPAVPPQRVVEEIAGAAAGLALIQPCCLSYSLSLPNKLFEYIVAGLPVLASDVPTIAAFVERTGTGLVVAGGDPRAIGRAMLAIVKPRCNQRLRVAVGDATAGLSWEREAESLKRAYRAAATQAGGGGPEGEPG
jgi:glycosyltransferase involved in cell wall biosynthesis